MYEAFYGLTEKPFNLTPDPHFLYLSKKHKEAFAHLMFGIKNRTGFVMVTGEVGTGKTTICRSLLGRLDSDTEVSFIFNPCLSQEELLQKINEDFGISSTASNVKDLVDELNGYLLEQRTQGKNCVLVIDEAQNLEPKVLEQIRLLSNLETEKEKLLQIVLIGQPELGEHLALPELRQLNQRITARYHLEPLNQEETLQYIAYRLRIAGGRRKIRFSRSSIRAVYKYSDGTPRVINSICDRALLIGYTLEHRDITKAIVKRAAKELRGERVHRKRKAFTARSLVPSPAFLMAVIIALLLVKLQYPSVPNDGTRDKGAAPPPAATNYAPAPPMEIQTVAAAVTHEEKKPAVEEKAAEAPPAPPEETLTQTLSDIDGATLRTSAALAILSAWDLNLVSAPPMDDSIGEFQNFAWVNQLAHEVLKLSLKHIEAIDLPALTRVKRNSGIAWVALVGVEDGQLRVTTDTGQTRLVSREEFLEQYTGQAVILWRNNESPGRILRKPHTGAKVLELQEQLVRLGRYMGKPNGAYDYRTTLAVAVMQTEAGLPADGITGKQTRMLLASWLPDIPTPSLKHGKPKEELIVAEEKSEGEAPLETEVAVVLEPTGPPSETPEQMTSASASEQTVSDKAQETDGEQQGGNADGNTGEADVVEADGASSVLVEDLDAPLQVTETSGPSTPDASIGVQTVQ